MEDAAAPDAVLETDDDRVQLEAFLSDEDTRRTVEQLISDMGIAQARVYKGGVGAAVKRLSEHRSPQVLIVDLTQSDLPLSDIDELADACEPGVTVITIGDRNDVGLFRDLMKYGVSDYLVKPISLPLLQKAILGSVDQGRASRQTSKLGALFVFMGVRGGVGATSLATSFAWCVAQQRRRRAALVDLDLQLGSVALALDLEPSSALKDALESDNVIDGLFLDRAMVQHSDRLFVLGCEERLEEPIEADMEALDNLLTELRTRFHYVIVDLPRAMNAVAQHAIQHATNVVLVTDLSLAGLRDTIRLNSVIPTLNAGCQLRVVANRVGDNRHGELTLREFEQGADRGVDFVVPNDPKAMAAAATEGQPIAAAKGSAAESVRNMAEGLWGEKKSAVKSSGGLLTKLLPRKS